MKQAGFYKLDWFVALLIGLVFAAASISAAPFLERFEFLIYDAGVSLTPRPAGGGEAAQPIAVIALDAASRETMKPWPWPRDRLAEVIEKLARVGPKAIGILLPLAEPQVDPGLVHIRELRERLAKVPPSGPSGRPPAILRELRVLLAQAEKALDGDGALARAFMRVRDRLYLGMHFEPAPAGWTESELSAPPPLPEYMAQQRFAHILDLPGSKAEPIRAIGAKVPLADFAERAVGIGHLNTIADSDGRVRSTPLAVEYAGGYYPSLALLLAARQWTEKPADMVLVLGEGVRLGDRLLPTDARLRLHHGFRREDEREPPFATYRFHEVSSEKVPPSIFRDKLVLIGPAASADYALDGTPSVLLAARTLAAMLDRDFYSRPVWAPWAEAGAFCLALAYLALVLPRLRGRSAIAASLVLVAASLAGGLYLLALERLWLKSATPALLIVAGHLAIGLKRLIQDGRRKAAEEQDAVQTNRLLGLAFQSQGQLDMAMDKFRRLPVDESVLALVYNLALDFERKRQFSKAAAAYDYILSHHPRFRDAAERKHRALQAEKTLLRGPRLAPGGTLILEGGEKPTLGRYELLEEIGKGAMGTVYLGRDPKLNRLVAIKTLALSQEFEAQEPEEVKARFFREAEAAGRLRHPHIVTIYDAGEEHDLAYIAMEYLPGKNLTHYLVKGEPLPLDWVMRIGMRVADALAYAHKHEVVHRDIKPANIVYNEDDDTLKITDFGIARITAATRTRTGVVLGTPSYMSPEQLSGRPVDGRSDLFSLGVTLFELTTGRQPFTGEELATLMYQIANERHPDVLRLRPDAPPCLARIINRALAKDPDRRYASGDDMRADLEQCLKRLPEREREKRRIRT
jgi:serine/threonine-protein kinase